MATYLVTGVSGALGSRLLPVLSAEAGTDRIVGVDRKPLLVSAPKFRYTQGDLARTDLVEMLDGVDTVVHLAASAGAPVLRKLLDACAEASVKSFVSLSSAAVFGAWPTNPVPLAEDSPIRPNPGFAYAVDLAEQERLLAEWRVLHPEVNVSVLRMAMVLGGGFERALTSALGGVAAHRHAESSRPVQFLHIDDAVSAIKLASVKKLNGVYNVAPTGFVADSTARAVAGAPPRPGLPKRVAYVANDLMWRRRYRSDFSAAEPYLEYPWVMSTDRVRAEGWRPSYSTEEALVAEAKPTWWGRLRPGQRRAIITGGIAAGAWISVFGSTGVVAYFVRRRRS